MKPTPLQGESVVKCSYAELEIRLLVTTAPWPSSCNVWRALPCRTSLQINSLSALSKFSHDIFVFVLGCVFVFVLLVFTYVLFQLWFIECLMPLYWHNQSPSPPLRQVTSAILADFHNSKMQSVKIRYESNWLLNCLERWLKTQILGFIPDLLKPSLWG